MGEHDGHRERLRGRFLASDGADMTDAQLLELALFYSVPRRDVRPLAEGLLARFGSVSGVFDASAEELREIAGVGAHSALLLGVLGSLRDAARATAELVGTRLTAKLTRKLLLSRLRGIGHDALLAIYVDREGLISAVKNLAAPRRPDPEELCRVAANQAALTGSPDLVLARGLAGAEPVPDRELSLAVALWRGLRETGVTLRDYVVVTPAEYISFAASLPSASLPFRPLSGGDGRRGHE